ncbi:putative Anti-sigma-B factor antagonist [Modestobacter italicus]|uniref:Anti-sigma factor antagonist n=1 Tax=Modestobacter italicus (strain DSM 44449 / CECT 9708 / BC 501) TaxID=2732864 RepID=I4F587_MODI5|nr:STAS domain-containing protein [Modestobacter marinus]CCH90800.1 putative Anti-sigma-B factor antagonist [Modestobacter marinus]
MSAPSGTRDLDVRVGMIDGGCTVTVVGEVDTLGAPVLGGCLDELLACPDVRAVELDLSGVTFLDSAGLTVLVRAHRTAEGSGRVLRLRCGTGRAVLRPLQLTGLVDVLTLADAPDGLSRHLNV